VVVCKVCGTENEQGAAFCGSCGSFLEWNGEPAVDDAPTAPAPTAAAPLAAVPTTSPSSSQTGSVASPPPDPGTGALLVCPACGTANEPSRTFCKRCATELAPPPAEPPAPLPAGRSGPPLALLGGAAAVIVLVLLGGAFLLSRGSPSDSATEAPSTSADVSPGASGLVAGSPSAIPPATGSPASSPSASPASSAIPPPATPPPSPTPTPATALTGQIVFTADKNGNANVWVWNTADQSQHKLVGGSGSQSDTSWAWDLSAVVYRTADGLRIINADGSAPAVPDLTHHGADLNPAWSADGKLIAFASTRSHGQGPLNGSLDIYTRPVADNTVTHRLTNDPADDWDPNWSPDGSTIAFASRRTGDGHLFLMNADGSNQREIDLGPGIYDDPSFSPDGQWLAFTRRQKAGALKELYVVHPDGTGMRRLTNVNVNQSDPTWSPDSKLIAVARGGTGSPIVIVDVATGEDLVQLGVNGAANRWPDWR